MTTDIDLHCHTSASDGTSSPKETVQKAAAAGVKVLAISDHDTTESFAEAVPTAQELGIRLIPSVEINSDRTQPVHVLGFFIDPSDQAFQKALESYREARLTRLRKIVSRLQNLGLPVSWDELLEEVHGPSAGRPHIADLLIKKGCVQTRDQAFQKYLAKDRPAYLPSEGPTPEEAIRIIRSAGGAAVLAHPAQMIPDATIEVLAKQGLDGIEAYYKQHTARQVKRYAALAEKHDLLATGGSDYHGPASGRENIGGVSLPEDTIQKLEERISQRKKGS